MLDEDLKVAYDLLNRRRLRWCKGDICACMGCANMEISREQWDRIEKIPEIAEILERRKQENIKAQQEFIRRLRNKEL